MIRPDLHAPLFGLSSDERVLVIAPHPDDETLGCGGTIARLTAAGVTVAVLVATVGPIHHHNDGNIIEPALREAEFTKACATLGVETAHIAWPDEPGDLDITTQQRRLVDLIDHDSDLSVVTFQPTVLFIPAAGAFHQDHDAVHRAAFAAARPRPANGPAAPRIVLGYRGGAETAWSRGAERWPLSVDTSRHWATKESALSCYSSQIPSEGHPRAISQICAIDRATGGAIGVEYAETFCPYRFVC